MVHHWVGCLVVSMGICLVALKVAESVGELADGAAD